MTQNEKWNERVKAVSSAFTNAAVGSFITGMLGPVIAANLTDHPNFNYLWIMQEGAVISVCLMILAQAALSALKVD